MVDPHCSKRKFTLLFFKQQEAKQQAYFEAIFFLATFLSLTNLTFIAKLLQKSFEKTCLVVYLLPQTIFSLTQHLSLS